MSETEGGCGNGGMWGLDLQPIFARRQGWGVWFCGKGAVATAGCTSLMINNNLQQVFP